MRAAGSVMRSSTTAAGNRGIASRILHALAPSSSFQGSGASIAGRAGVAAALTSLALALTLAVGVSAAGAGVKVPSFTFGSSGTLGGQLAQARGIAVNETGNGGVAAGTVYVADFGNNRIQAFDADGNFVRAWGHDVVSGGGTGFEVCEVAADCKAGVAGGAAGQFNAIAGGIAVDQATGNVSIVDRGNNRVQQFDAEGGFLRAWGRDVDSTGIDEFEICDVAANCKAGLAGNGAGMFGGSNALPGIGVDSSGNVYVADTANRRVQKFSSTGAFIAAAGWDVDSANPSTGYEVCTVAADCKQGTSGAGVGQFGTNLPSFLAADAAGDVFTVGKTNGTIYGLTSALAFGQEFAATTGTGTNPNRNALAIDSSVGNVFFGQASPVSTNIFELDPAADLVVGTHPVGGDQWVGLAINSVTGRMYGARTAAAGPDSSVIHVFEEGPPTATTGAATANTGTKATLNGTVNPNGAALTDCYFEYGTTNAYGQTAACDQTPAAIGDGTDPVDVTADIGALKPQGTQYHFRLVAVNAEGTNEGSNQTFTTPNTLATTAATALADTTATLNGTVNPDGVAIADCEFDYGTTTAYGQTAPCVPNPAAIGTGTSPVAVHGDIAGLHPGTVYRYRLTATNADGHQIAAGNQSLLTLGPSIADTWSQDVTISEAKLFAQINPRGVATTYHFEYGTTDSYGQQTPELSVASDSTIHTVTRSLDGLQSGTTYHYRAVATSTDGVNEGPDRTFTTHAPHTPDTGCPNQQFRTGPSANLPDCRAYEMVSPIDKNGGDVEAAEAFAGLSRMYKSAFRQASVEGGKITYSSATAFPGAAGGHFSNQYLATRGPGGWSTEPISALRSQVFSHVMQWQTTSFFHLFSPDLSSAWVVDDNVNPLTADALQGHVNLYRRDNDTRSYLPLTIEGPYGQATAVLGRSGDIGGTAGGPRVLGHSGDLRHQVFVASAALTPDASLQDGGGGGTVDQLYDLVDGKLHLVSVLPDGTAAATNSSVGTGRSPMRLANYMQGIRQNAVSDDGSRIVWTTTSDFSTGPGAIYVRENSGAEQSVSGACDEPGRACTRHVAGVASAPSLSPDRAQFWAASADGSKVLYSLSNAPPRGTDRVLHIHDVDTGESTEIAGQSAGVAGAADDLSHIYFVSREARAPGAVAGANNLYDYHDGEYSLISVATSDDLRAANPGFGGSTMMLPNLTGLAASDARPELVSRQTRVSSDGRFLVFMSNSRELSESVAGYDSTDAVSGVPAFQVYRYDAVGGELACVSCNPTGERPRTHFVRLPYSSPGTEFTAFPELRVAGSIPTWETDGHASRVLSDDGDRVVFHSDEALVPQDTNGVADVYRWQTEGSDGCNSSDGDYSAQNKGCVSLISSGRDPGRSEFVDADPSGDEVYFATDESIDPRDTGNRDIYVAKVGGGFAPPPAPTPVCGVLAGACQGVGAVPASADPIRSGASTPAGNAPRRPRMHLSVAVASGAKARRLAARRGVVRLAVRASGPGVVRALARARIGPRVRRIGGRSVRARKAGRVVLALRLNRVARKRLAAGRALRVMLRVTSPGARARTATLLLPGVKS